MQKILICGNIGNDATVNQVNNKSVINFNVCHSERYKDAQGTQHTKSVWHNCSYWVERSGIAPYLKKGTTVFVEGQVEASTYQDSKGQTVPQLRVRVTSIQLIGGSQNNTSANQNQQQGNYSSGNSGFNASDVTEPIDSLPF